MMVVALVGVSVILYAWRLPPFATAVVRTDNSYVRGQITVLAPQVNGYVTDVLVNDYQKVKAGEPLVEIDDRIYRQQLEQAEAGREQAQAQLANAEQTMAQNRAEIEAREADLFQAKAALEQAQATRKRSDALARKGLNTRAEAGEIEAALRSAEAGVRRAEASIDIAKETLRATEVSKKGLAAAVRTAEAQVHLAEINLSNTVVRAPRDGQIGEATVRPGQYVSAGSQLMFLVPDTLWVVANFKETQTHYVAAGQKASFAVDALGGRHFTGTVLELAPATGSEFSVLRADNASGNFTKVVQRVPVRIAIDPDQPELERLRPGLSVETRVDTSNLAPEETGWLSRFQLPAAIQEWLDS
ncbi:HlyD family secretion protein [Fulvimarina sp. MAC3]|uniref:HlyD family secretion protein n=1 Tax=Fulvimarina sp. MAC3 TaxID=3148887 RepID=UPI0031FC8605